MSNLQNSSSFFNENGFAIIKGKFFEEVKDIKLEIIDYLNFFGKKNNLTSGKDLDYDYLVRKIMIPGTKLRTFLYDSAPFLESIQKLNHHSYIKEFLKDFGYKKPVCVDMSNIRFDIKDKNEIKFLRGIHQDVRSIRSKKTVTIWIPVTKVDQDHGTVVMYPKTQNFGLIKHVYKPNLLIEENNLPKNINELENNKFIIDANPGDLVVFNCFTLHRSEQARVDKVRSVIQITYTDINEVNMEDNLFFLNSEFDAFAQKDKSLQSTLK
tara:strand:+ start:694 stop:1494 length:801 start_codon:yes stop_codon:yes gene_type:complete